MNEEQGHYELCYIVPIKYIEADLNKVNDKVIALLKEFKAEITYQDVLGKQKLAYPIEKINQGTYVVLEFDMDREHLKKFGEQLKIMNEVLRHLIITKKIKTEEELKHEKKIKDRLMKEKEDELKQIEEQEKATVKKSEPRPVKKVESVKEEKEVAKDEKVEEKLEKSKQEDVVEEKVEEEKEKETEKPTGLKEKKEKSKASLDDLDKKLDEILTDDII